VTFKTLCLIECTTRALLFLLVLSQQCLYACNKLSEVVMLSYSALQYDVQYCKISIIKATQN